MASRVAVVLGLVACRVLVRCVFVEGALTGRWAGGVETKRRPDVGTDGRMPKGIGGERGWGAAGRVSERRLLYGNGLKQAQDRRQENRASDTASTVFVSHAAGRCRCSVVKVDAALPASVTDVATSPLILKLFRQRGMSE